MNQLSAEAYAIIEGRHSDPFRYLGLHKEGGKTIVRAFLPEATEVNAVGEHGTAAKLTRIHEAGLFAGAAPEGTERYPDLHLVFSGSKQNNQGNVVERIHELGLEGRVRILGYVDSADIPALYSLSRMLVLPTLFESISIPVYEAFALGVPVCSSNVVALPEQIDNAGLLFDPNNPSDIASKIAQILDDPTGYLLIGVALDIRGGRRRAPAQRC